MSHSMLYRCGKAGASLAFAVLFGMTTLQAQQGRIEGTVSGEKRGIDFPMTRADCGNGTPAK